MKEHATFLAGLLAPIVLIFALVYLVAAGGARVLMIAALIAFVLFWLNRHRGEFVNAAGLVAAACLFGSILLILQGSNHFAAAFVLLLAGLVLAVLSRRANLARKVKPLAGDGGSPAALSDPPRRTPLQYDLCPECHGVKTVTRLTAKPCQACGGTGLVGPDRCPRDCDNGKSWEWETVECPTCLGHGRMLA